MKPILDACCGGRMIWFDHDNPLAVFVDKRKESLTLCDGRILHVNPDIVADFTHLPFAHESFHLVVFDPPHLRSLGENSWLAKKYGRLIGDWRDEISEGFKECFRVLKRNGTLVFKWSDAEVSLNEILQLAPQKPAFGHTGQNIRTHWICFFKT